MQTFMYVVGPFVLEICLGLAAVMLALGYVWLSWIPTARRINAQRAKLELESRRLREVHDAILYARDAKQLLCEIVVSDAQLPSPITNRVDALISAPIESYHNYKKELL